MAIHVDDSRVFVFLSFLGQTDCKNTELQQELESLSRDLDLSRDYSSNSPYTPDSGELETDGHFPSSNIGALLAGVQPQVDLGRPENDQVDAEALRAVTAELRNIADQFECSVVARATDSLAKKLCSSAIYMWKAHLTLEVEWIVKHSRGFDLPQERVMMALALTLVKGVCERTPHLLRSLFDTTLQFLQ